YANAFKSVEALTPKTTVDVLKRRNDMTISAYANFALGWAAEGATIIGGCCEISPEHIAFLFEALSNAGYQPTTLV
ncbi:MAG: homocysteine S-methyltransferase family protein, partial [Pseudomonadota bacterium]|nr:homocysteine S-methyltransferase family protein [Pseudomonadota bacterium]